MTDFIVIAVGLIGLVVVAWVSLVPRAKIACSCGRHVVHGAFMAEASERHCIERVLNERCGCLARHDAIARARESARPFTDFRKGSGIVDALDAPSLNGSAHNHITNDMGAD